MRDEERIFYSFMSGMGTMLVIVLVLQGEILMRGILLFVLCLVVNTQDKDV